MAVPFFYPRLKGGFPKTGLYCVCEPMLPRGYRYSGPWRPWAITASCCDPPDRLFLGGLIDRRCEDSLESGQGLHYEHSVLMKRDQVDGPTPFRAGHSVGVHTCVKAHIFCAVSRVRTASQPSTHPCFSAIIRIELKDEKADRRVTTTVSSNAVSAGRNVTESGVDRRPSFHTSHVLYANPEPRMWS